MVLVVGYTTWIGRHQATWFATDHSYEYNFSSGQRCMVEGRPARPVDNKSRRPNSFCHGDCRRSWVMSQKIRRCVHSGVRQKRTDECSLHSRLPVAAAIRAVSSLVLRDSVSKTEKSLEKSDTHYFTGCFLEDHDELASVNPIAKISARRTSIGAAAASEARTRTQTVEISCANFMMVSSEI